MRKVTKDQFFAIMNPQDIRLRCEKLETLWETTSRRVLGKSTPGYMCQTPDGKYTDQKEWFLAD